MSIKTARLPLCLVFLVGLSPSFLIGQVRYRVIDLGVLPGTSYSAARSINEVGQITGNSGTRMFLWDGSMIDLGTFGAITAMGLGINDLGQIVGSKTSTGSERAILWDNGVVTDLGNLTGCTNAKATAINNVGQAVGQSSNCAHPEAFRWDEVNGMIGLGLGSPGIASIAYGINNSGSIVGGFNKPSGNGAFIWTNGTMTDIGALANSTTLAVGINDSGVVVGSSQVQTRFHPFLWQSGVMIDLGRLSPNSSAYAQSINNKGQVVGYDNSVTGNHALLWGNGTVIDLNTVVDSSWAWSLQNATDINDNGQIVGFGLHNGQSRAFLLDPVKIRITTPLAGERWIAGGQDTIRWEGRALGTFVAVDYSTDSGQTYTNIVPAALLDSLIWSIPTNILTTRAKVRVRTVATPLHTAISDTFKIKGDVLTRIDPKGHYEAFSPRKHGWSYLNGTLWPATWWSQFQYATGLDPNTGAPYPVSFQAVAPSIFVDWPLWVDVFSTNACYWSTAFPGSYNATAQTKWATSRGVHNGSCEGFAISSFLAFSYPNQFFTRHNIPNVDSLFKLALNDTIRKTINRYYTYQYGKPSLDNDVPGQAKDPRTTLREIRNMFRGDSVDIRPVYVYNLGPSGGAHTMAPISVTVDGTGPSRYRVNLYDSNNPGVATPYILVDSLNNRWVDSTGLRWGPSPTHFYLGIPVSNHLATPAMGRPPSGYSPRGLNNWEFYNNSDAEVVYTSSTGNRIGFADSGLIDEMQDGVAIFNRNGRPSKPIGYYIPNDTYSVTLARVRDSSGGAHVTVFKDDVVYAYERANDDSMLTDRLQFGSGFSVASPDTAQKQISLNVIARLDSSERIFFVRNTQLRQNDSLFTREISQSNLVLKNYGTAKTYHLEINERSAQEQEIFVHPLIALPANSTHTIVPNWIDLDGSPIEILVDLGNNGTIDDTLIVNNTVDVDDRGDLGVPREYHLAQNYPNPFNPNTRIEYTLPQAGHVNLSVYNVLGQHVATLVDEERSAGRYSVEWNGTSANGGILGSGVYFYTMIARPSAGGETFRRTGKMLLLK